MRVLVAILATALAITLGVNVSQATHNRQQRRVVYTTGKFNTLAFESNCEDILNRAVDNGDVNMYDYNRRSCQSVAASLPNYWRK